MAASKGTANERILLVTGESGVRKTPLIQEMIVLEDAHWAGQYALSTPLPGSQGSRLTFTYPFGI